MDRRPHGHGFRLDLPPLDSHSSGLSPQTAMIGRGTEMRPLEGKVALVTGGGRGIGRGIALALAEAGAGVAIAEIDKLSSSAHQYGTPLVGGLKSARETVREIVSQGRRSTAIQADVRCKNDTQRMVEETTRQLGGLNILVCNAGVVTVAPIETLPEEVWDLTLAVNAKGVFLSCQAAIPVMRAGQGGCIINIASVAGKTGRARMVHYCASKYAVVGFTNALAKELAPFDIRVNAICPGLLRTQMWEYLAGAFREGSESKEDVWQRYVKTVIPLRRPQTPQDVGQLAVYLALAKNITGQAINLDGGLESH